METIDIHYGVVFGKCDSSDWIDWTVCASEEEKAIYDRDLLLMINPNEDERLQNLLKRAYDDIEQEEIGNGIDYEEEYVLECMGLLPVEPDEINKMVEERDQHTLEFFELTDLSDEELDEWDANDLDELPNVCDFEENFEPESPFDQGWTLIVEFYDLESLEKGQVEKTLRVLFEEKDYEAIHDYVKRASGYTGELSEDELEDMAKKIAVELGVQTDYEQ